MSATLRRHPRASSTNAGACVVAHTLKGQRGKGGGGIGPEETLISHALTTSQQRLDPNGETFVTIPQAATLTSGSHPGSAIPGRHKEDDTNLVAFYPTMGSRDTPGKKDNHLSPPSKVGSGVGASSGIAFAQRSVVRRLTPVECERLMGWPDGWTAPPGVKAPDSRRYAACGDGVVANVAEWIGRRIMAVQAIT